MYPGFFFFFSVLVTLYSRLSGSEGNESSCNAGDPGLIPGLGISPGEGDGYPLQYSCLENSKDSGGWRATVQGVAKSQTWAINTLTFTLPYMAKGKIFSLSSCFRVFVIKTIELFQIFFLNQTYYGVFFIIPLFCCFTLIFLWWSTLAFLE